MTDPSDEPLDALLREAFNGPVPADGFCERVMTQLPARPRRFRVWPPAAGVAAGMTACWASLRCVPAIGADWRGWLALAPAPSSSTLVMLTIAIGISLLAAAWALAESNDPEVPFRLP